MRVWRNEKEHEREWLKAKDELYQGMETAHKKELDNQDEIKITIPYNNPTYTSILYSVWKENPKKVYLCRVIWKWLF